MDQLWLLLRAQVRGQGRSWLGIAILAGILGGAIIATLAGARRTETAYARFLEGTRAFDVILTNGTNPSDYNQQFDFDEVASLPQVVDAAVINYYFPSGRTESGQVINPSVIGPFASPDGRFGTELNGMRVVEGRLPQGDREVVITPVVADLLDVQVGSTMWLDLTSPPAADDESRASSEIAFRVVGEVAMQAGFPPITGGLPPPVILSPEYARSHPDAVEAFAVRLGRGAAGIADFDRALARLTGGEQVVSVNRTEFAALERGLAVQATALRVVAGLAGVVSLLVLGQVLVRRSVMQSADNDALHSLGVTRAQLRAVGVAWAVLPATCAACLAVVVAVALSSLTPVGVARKAELHPGIELNLAHVGLGALGILLLVGGLSVGATWVSTRRRATMSSRHAASSRRPSRVGSVLSEAGVSIAATSGVRMALETGSGRSAVPVRSTIVSATLAVAMTVGVVGFSASLGELFDDPRLYGWNWDVQIGDEPFGPAEDGLAEALVADPAVEAVSVATTRRVGMGDVLVDLLATEPRKGALAPTVVRGRAPAAPNEILLGTRTERDLNVGLGDTVDVRSGDRSEEFLVVGAGVLPEFAGAARLGSGAALTLDGIRRLHPGTSGGLVLARMVPDARGDALLAELVDRPRGNAYVPSRPSDLVDLRRVGGLPSLLAGLLGTMAVATLAHALMSSVRRRRRELAILKALGFVRRQVSAAIAWQASVLALIATAIGVPLGAAAGQEAWRRFAEQLGVPPRPVVPLLALVLVLPVTLLLANLTAALPARWAARTPPSAALRAE